MTLYMSSSSFCSFGGNNRTYAIKRAKLRNKIADLEQNVSSSLVRISWKGVEKILSAAALDDSPKRRRKKRDIFCIIHWVLFAVGFLIKSRNYPTQIYLGNSINPHPDIWGVWLFSPSIGYTDVRMGRRFYPGAKFKNLHTYNAYTSEHTGRER